MQFSRLDSGQVALHGFVPGLSRCGQQSGRRDSGTVSGIHTPGSALHYTLGLRSDVGTTTERSRRPGISSPGPLRQATRARSDAR